MKPFLRFAILTGMILLFSDAMAASSTIAWQPWSDDVFKTAQKENRFVLLDLEAVWCHWCHVMDEKTYSNAKVIELVGQRYLPVRVDQDSRPDLSNRYENYGWPATIIFAPDGQELVKRAGYIPPEIFASLLQAVIDDPTPGPSVQAPAKIDYTKSAFLTDELRRTLRASYFDHYDFKNGGFGFSQKFLQWDAVELAMLGAARGDKKEEKMARDTLRLQVKLLDPAWGGVYQYSTGGNWNAPHFEKIMAMQAENLHIYALAYGQWRESLYLQTAEAIARYLETFLKSPEGAFYTSQDADLVRGEHSAEFFKLGDGARRKRGMPSIDKHIYARENGWAVVGFTTLYAVTGEKKYLETAQTAARWILKNRSLGHGGFRHDEKDSAGPYLGDTLAMARAQLALYAATGERDWLKGAEKSAQFIDKTFLPAGDLPGYWTVKPQRRASLPPVFQRDENIALARFANLLAQYTGEARHHQIAERAMRYVATPDIARELPTEATLLADDEMSRAPVHITVIGAKKDPRAQALFAEAIRYPETYKRVEWWDSREGRLPNADVQYPELDRPAAFACAQSRCSLPVFEPGQLRARVAAASENSN